MIKEKYTIKLTFDELIIIRARLEINGRAEFKKISSKINKQMLKQPRCGICGR